MSARTWSMYRLDTGELIGQTYGGPVAGLAANTPDGCGAIAGRWDASAWAVDLVRVAAVPRGAVAPDAEALATEARSERDRLLAATDWLTLRAIETGLPVPAAWIAYRAALRDVPEQAGFPVSISWPTAPLE